MCFSVGRACEAGLALLNYFNSSRQLSDNFLFEKENLFTVIKVIFCSCKQKAAGHLSLLKLRPIKPLISCGSLVGLSKNRVRLIPVEFHLVDWCSHSEVRCEYSTQRKQRIASAKSCNKMDCQTGWN